MLQQSWGNEPSGNDQYVPPPPTLYHSTVLVISYRAGRLDDWATKGVDVVDDDDDNQTVSSRLSGYIRIYLQVDIENR